VDTQLYLIHLIKLLVKLLTEATIENTVSQRSLFKSLYKVLEENKVGIPTDLRLHFPSPFQPTIHGLSIATAIEEEIKKKHFS
jgi:hypothetical protein